MSAPIFLRAGFFFWYQNESIRAVFWPYFGRIRAVFWPYQGRILAVSGPYQGRILAVSGQKIEISGNFVFFSVRVFVFGFQFFSSEHSFYPFPFDCSPKNTATKFQKKNQQSKWPRSNGPFFLRGGMVWSKSWEKKHVCTFFRDGFQFGPTVLYQKWY